MEVRNICKTAIAQPMQDEPVDKSVHGLAEKQARSNERGMEDFRCIGPVSMSRRVAQMLERSKTEPSHSRKQPTLERKSPRVPRLDSEPRNPRIDV